MTAPHTLSVESGDHDTVWSVCSCGWTHCFVSGVSFGEFGYRVHLHAETHRSNRTRSTTGVSA